MSFYHREHQGSLWEPQGYRSCARWSWSTLALLPCVCDFHKLWQAEFENRSSRHWCSAWFHLKPTSVFSFGWSSLQSSSLVALSQRCSFREAVLWPELSLACLQRLDFRQLSDPALRWNPLLASWVRFEAGIGCYWWGSLEDYQQLQE